MEIIEWSEKWSGGAMYEDEISQILQEAIVGKKIKVWCLRSTEDGESYGDFESQVVFRGHSQGRVVMVVFVNGCIMNLYRPEEPTILGKEWRLNHQYMVRRVEIIDD